MEYFLSRHGWQAGKYMFAPQQMFTINNQEVPLLNRQADFLLGAAIFLWSDNLTKVQNAASNYSIDYNTFLSQGFFDT